LGGIKGSFDTQKKQEIRELLWNKAFDDIINKEGFDPKKIRYFELPGSECIYIRQICQKFNIRKDNIVAVEQDPLVAIPIHRFLGGKGGVKEGKLEDICEKGELDFAFPFDIINLDFCGQAFVFSGNDYQRRWNVIRYFIKSNRSKNKKIFYILLTLLGSRSNNDGKNFLLKQITELNKITGSAKNPSNWKEYEIIQQALPKIIIDEALDNDYEVTLIDSYNYRQEEHTSNMVSFSFKLNKIETYLGNGISTKSKLLENASKLYYSQTPKKI
jgi:hypothetical protein